MNIFDVALERSGLLESFKDKPIEFLAHRFGKTEQEIKQMVEPQWFPAEVLWISQTTATLVTTFPNNLVERRFVFLLDQQQHPTAKDGYLQFEWRDKSATQRLTTGAKLMFRFRNKQNELLAKKGTNDPTLCNILTHDIQWCYQADYNKANAKAKATPLYRLVTYHEHRSWETPVTVEEREQWKGKDLTKPYTIVKYHWVQPATKDDLRMCNINKLTDKFCVAGQWSGTPTDTCTEWDIQQAQSGSYKVIPK